MALSDKVYRVFESIVGKENINQDPAILDTYCFNWLVEFDPAAAPGKFLPYRPEAVLLPGDVGEVQDIVKACNRYGVKYKAFSTGYGAHSMPWQPGVIILDLRRMNRILEIDEKNKFAVLEPYCSWAQLGGEAMKRGLFSTHVQAGSQASPLANITSGWGMNTMGFHGGHNGRNVLGVEWVLPTGELLKLGPPDEWFTGDNPGPSLRGIMRGHVGAQGGMGVFTKAAIKLHSWPGPPELETVARGNFLNYSVKEKPENYQMYIPSFDTYEDMVDCMYKIGDAEVGYAVMRVGEAKHMLAIMAGGISNKTFWEWHQSGMIEMAAEQIKHPLMIVVWCNSKKEFEFQKKVINDIFAETNANFAPILETDLFREMMDVEFIVHVIGNDTHFAHHAGGFLINAGYMGTTEAVYNHMGYPVEGLKQKFIDDGEILDDGADSTYLNLFDHNGFIYVEMEFHYDAANAESVQACRELISAEREFNRDKKLGFEPNDIGLCVGDSKMSCMERVADMGGRYDNFHLWQEKIKNIFDPKNVSDRSNYGAGVSGQKMLPKEYQLAEYKKK